jgi:arylsulfatase A
MHSRPNIIYVLADDMGYGDVSCLNPDSRIHTRHLDRLAAEGMLFHDAHAASAVCTPSRYSILTGRYSWRSWLKHGVTFGYTGPLIEPGRETVASFLKAQGYRTGCVGKWHLGWTWARHGQNESDVDFSQPITNGPCDYGFDSFFGISASLDMEPYVYIENNRVTAIPDRVDPGVARPKDRPAGDVGFAFWREGPMAPDFRHEEVLPTFTKKALDFIASSATSNQPFFLYFPLTAPHTPILPAPGFRGKSGLNPYGDFCLQVDDVVGQLMDAVDRLGITGNTLLIFTTDNGCSPSADLPGLAALGHYPSYVFRGHKADIYEGGHRIPLICRWPAVVAPGSASNETVCLADLLATCSDILGIALPDNAAEDSVSMLPILQGRPLKHPPREATVHHSVDGSFSIRMGPWKLDMCPGSGGWSHPQPGPECQGLPPMQLYDLRQDIGERRNMIDHYPDVVRKLTDLLTGYVRNGRSTPGRPQPNTGSPHWDQLWWIDP